jgi:hypothetical protein
MENGATDPQVMLHCVDASLDTLFHVSSPHRKPLDPTKLGRGNPRETDAACRAGPGLVMGEFQAAMGRGLAEATVSANSH